MTVEQKWTYFQMLVKTGFTEIDVSFPSASQTEFDFTRKLVETAGAVPDSVWLQVLSPCRIEHINRAVESVTGAKKAIISLYIASSDSFQEIIFGMTRQQVLDLAVDCVRHTRSITKDHPVRGQQTEWNLMFSPEAFSDTDVSYSVQLCEAVKAAWGPTEANPIILNLPATVEMSTPNAFADQVEIFCRSITDKDKVCVSLHPHNDRGCAVAAAELGQLAGATRVEGCLFGNGERTGNVDLVTLALNLYSQGVDPHLDFSDLAGIKRVAEECTRIRVHPRAPYAGDFVFLAYSGSHQDAINKGFKKLRAGETRNKWKIPYLAIDPEDIGRTYESVIQINSQSGKGGVAWTLQRAVGLDLPKGFQIAFSRIVKDVSDRLARTMTPEEIIELFLETYDVLNKDPRIIAARYTCLPHGDGVAVEAELVAGGQMLSVSGSGYNVLAAVQDAVVRASSSTTPQLSLKSYERTLSPKNGQIHTIQIVECQSARLLTSSWGANVANDTRMAIVLSAFAAALVSGTCCSGPLEIGAHANNQLQPLIDQHPSDTLLKEDFHQLVGLSSKARASA
ncbi:Pyruvate carboxyltransferase [Macrophomina phaseolina MS6]|uniref:2-isopropylmalate synthase n=1 Tax=Macrophomina phaseolina (strain MS6) TaxID=1126212 RepID=K2RYP6_MACPH|nr:Pyruvate carboxyltransferase [Macrophomina phaseolina MS6]